MSLVQVFEWYKDFCARAKTEKLNTQAGKIKFTMIVASCLTYLEL